MIGWQKPCRRTGPSVIDRRIAVFGLSWRASQDDVRGRFAGLTPDRVGLALVWPIDAVSDRLSAEQAFVPDAVAASDRPGDALCCQFGETGLAETTADFGYRFEAIGQNPDALSDLAMAAIARSEWSRLLQQLAARYSAPDVIAEGPARAGSHHITGWALILDAESVIRVSFGHDVRGLAGQINYLPRTQDVRGF